MIVITRVEGTSFGPNGPGTAFFTGGRLLQIGDDRQRVLPVEMGEILPRHDRREHAAVRADSGGEGGDDLVVGPGAEAGLLVGRQVAADERAQARQAEADVGAAEGAGKIGLAEESSRACGSRCNCRW